MTEEICIYVEGGGDGNAGRAAIRRGFGEFLRELRDLARQRRIHWDIVACGPRGRALKAFSKALREGTHAFNVLLVDSEGPVSAPPWEHLAERDEWKKPEGATQDQCHLMVQAMEAWLVAEPGALAEHYGQGFKKGKLPRRRDVETIAKSDLEPALERATEETTKGRYHKIRHGAKLLAMIDQTKVRARAPHCERLFKSLTEVLQTAG